MVFTGIDLKPPGSLIFNKKTMDPKDNTPGNGGIDLIPAGTDNPEKKNEEGKIPAGNGEEGKGKETPAKTFTQDEVNAIVARQKREDNERISKLKAAGLSDDQIATLEKKEAIQGSAEELAKVRQERVALVLDQNKDLVGRMDPAYVEKLKTAAPEDVETVIANTRKMVTDIEAGNKTPGKDGNMPSLEDGKLPAGVAAKDQKLIEGISSFEKTGDPTQMVQGLVESWGIKL